MKKIFQYSILAVATLLASCKDDEMLGPQIEDLNAEFSVTQEVAPDNSTPDFSKAPVNISAKFDKKAAWKITITDRKNKTQKSYTGASKEVMVSWDGGADNLPFFGTDTCDIVLSYPNFPDRVPSTAILVIKGLGDPDKGGVIITDFKVSKLKEIYDGKFTDTTKWMSDFRPTKVQGVSPNSADGSPYLYSEGTANADTYVDQLMIYANASDKAYGKVWPLVNDPGRVYFNAMVYCSLNDTAHYKDATISFIFAEEGGNTASYNVDPNWEGWKIMSVKYSDMKFKNASIAPRPDKIRMVSIVILSKGTPLASYKVRVAYDHLIWTTDKPFGQ